MTTKCLLRDAVVLLVIVGACKKSEDRRSEPPTTGASPSVAGSAAQAPPVVPSGKSVTISSSGVGPISAAALPSSNDPAEAEKAIKKLLAGYDVVGKPEESEGGGWTNWIASKAGVPYLTIEGTTTVRVVHNSIKDPKGIGPGSSHHELLAAYPDLSCGRDQSLVRCHTVAMKGVDYEFDVSGVAGGGNAVPPPATMTSQKIMDITVGLIGDTKHAETAGAAPTATLSAAAPLDGELLQPARIEWAVAGQKVVLALSQKATDGEDNAIVILEATANGKTTQLARTVVNPAHGGSYHLTLRPDATVQFTTNVQLGSQDQGHDQTVTFRWDASNADVRVAGRSG